MFDAWARDFEDCWLKNCPPGHSSCSKQPVVHFQSETLASGILTRTFVTIPINGRSENAVRLAITQPGAINEFLKSWPSLGDTLDIILFKPNLQVLMMLWSPYHPSYQVIGGDLVDCNKPVCDASDLSPSMS